MTKTTKIIKIIEADEASGDYICAINEAAALIRAGELVAFPTETVYGLGADATNPAAVNKIFQAKGRPQDNPLIAHVSSIEEAQEIAFFTPLALELAQKFWPGPLTLVMKAKSGAVCIEARAGLDTVAVRIPSCPVALNLIRASGVPIAAPSANISGRPSPTDAASVLEDMDGKIPLILDGGPCQIGLESSVIDVSGEAPALLRPGGIDAEALNILNFLNILIGEADTSNAKSSPGTRHRHYAPSLPLYLLARGDTEIIKKLEEENKKGTQWAYMGISPPPVKPSAFLISQDTKSYAASLFKSMRTLENSGASFIVAEIPADGALTRAIEDRLKRASKN